MTWVAYQTRSSYSCPESLSKLVARARTHTLIDVCPAPTRGQRPDLHFLEQLILLLGPLAQVLWLKPIQKHSLPLPRTRIAQISNHPLVPGNRFFLATQSRSRREQVLDRHCDCAVPGGMLVARRLMRFGSLATVLEDRRWANRDQICLGCRPVTSEALNARKHQATTRVIY